MEHKLTLPTVSHCYQMLNKVTPTTGDCGVLCQKACCQDTSKQMGIYLLPGEEQLFNGREDWLHWERHQAEEYDFPHSWQGLVHFVRCTKSCPRNLRPLQCRSYPLAPHLEKNFLYIIYETTPLPYTCPLIAKKIPLRQDFVQAVTETWQLLIANKLVKDLVKLDSTARRKNNTALMIVKAVKLV